MAYVGYTPQNIPVPPYYVNPPVDGCTPPYPPYPVPPVPPVPPFGPHGKLPVDGFLINYEGIPSDTAEVTVDNRRRTIKVDVDKFAVDNIFEYKTSEPMSSWQIVHNLNKYPNVTLTDWDYNVIVADIKYVDKNKIIVNLSEPICGRAFLG